LRCGRRPPDACGAIVENQKLSRVQGLAHPSLTELWKVVDTVLGDDELVRRLISGSDASNGGLR
jgi:hypothetical protein